MNEPLIRAIQSRLGLTVDGIAGPETWAAIHDALIPPAVDIDVAGSVDPRSAANIQTLRPVVRPLATDLIRELNSMGLTFKVTSAYRTYDEQNDLYEQGRSKPGKIVTNARGGYSNHNFAVAFDITQFKNGQPIWDGPDYATAGKMGKKLGLLWGGDWTFRDEPHFEYRPDYAKDMTESEALAEYRSRVLQGISVV